jgi:PKD repeat protein
MAQPNANFSGSPTSGPAPLTVQFTNLSMGANSYTWLFGDGATSNDINPTHTYMSNGSYTVTLTALNTVTFESDTEIKTDYITVSPPVPPTADFVATPTSGMVPLTVLFTDVSTSGSGTINHWSWDFGDGTPGNSFPQNPVHTYDSVGTYTVTLTVTDDLGLSNSETKTDYISVSPPASIEQVDNKKIPSKYKLYPSYPNPFNPQTNIRFEVPGKSKINISIYNSLGQKIRTLVNETLLSGVYEVKWDGLDESSIRSPSGVYVVSLRSDNFIENQKVVLIK